MHQYPSFLSQNKMFIILVHCVSIRFRLVPLSIGHDQSKMCQCMNIKCYAKHCYSSIEFHLFTLSFLHHYNTSRATLELYFGVSADNTTDCFFFIVHELLVLAEGPLVSCTNP